MPFDLVRRAFGGALLAWVELVGGILVGGIPTAADSKAEDDSGPTERIAAAAGPRNMGLRCREGKVEPGAGRRVIAAGENGKPRVAL